MGLCEHFFPIGKTDIPIELSINSDSGPLEGLGSKVRIKIRRLTDNFFLDFVDTTFKASGHVLSEKILDDAGGGRYRTTFNSTAASITDDTYVMVEFIIDEDGALPRVATALYRISDFFETIIDKANRT